jgi:hypothetical protein
MLDFFWRQLGGKSIYDFKTYLLVSTNKICTFAVLKHYTRTSIDIIIKNIEKHGSGLFY